MIKFYREKKKLQEDENVKKKKLSQIKQIVIKRIRTKFKRIKIKGGEIEN